MPFVPINRNKNQYKPTRSEHYSKSAKLYASSAWKKTRVWQLSMNPLCQRCVCYGKVVVATDVDHVYPHKGDFGRFFNTELCSLCHSCHSWKTQQESLGKIYTWKEKREILIV